MSNRSGDQPLVRATGLGKRFKLYTNPYHRVSEWLSFGRRVRHDAFWAVRNVDIELRRGDCIGIIGVNGSGKSTLLKLLSNTLSPTEGAVEIHGRVLALTELVTGFNVQLSGRANIRYVGQMLGIDESYIEARADDIIEFADLGGHIDQPVRSYSSGMFARLSFSLYAFLEPDVLMIDEVLSVGDQAFKRKCFDLIEHMVRDQQRATVYVSHGMTTVARLATQVIWLDAGQVRMRGEPVEVIDSYLHHFGQEGLDGAPPPREQLGEAGESDAARPIPSAKLLFAARSQNRFSEPVSIGTVWLENFSGKHMDVAWAETPFQTVFAVAFGAAVSSPVFRVTIDDGQANQPDGCDVDSEERHYDAGQTQIVAVAVRRGFPTGRYSVQVECLDSEGTTLARVDKIPLTVIAYPGPTGLPPRFGAAVFDQIMESTSTQIVETGDRD